MAAIDDVIAERKRQIETEGWSQNHDDEHTMGELALAASCYAAHAGGRRDFVRRPHAMLPRGWPHWAPEWWKPKTPRRDLIRAAALIVAEIERLDRLPPPPEGGE